MKREAMYYTKLRGNTLRCELCPHYCALADGEVGKCRSRQNSAGILYAINYARACGMAIDPIEKKPLYHYHPGSQILSLGPNSCNLSCRFCQNYRISQYEAATQELSPMRLRALLDEHSPDNLQVAFTYTEPLTWYEYIMDFARAYPEVRIALISNGYINPAPLAEILPHISAMNIDLKAMGESFYFEQCGGHLKPIQESIRACVAAGVHLELTFLMIPGLNDAEDEILAMADFIAGLNPELPLHISAYHPSWELTIKPTTLEDVSRALKLARTKLLNVYGGNLPVTDYMDTVCKKCNALTISRDHFAVQSFVGVEGSCPQCGARGYGVYE